MSEPAELEATIERRLREFDPAIELIAVERPAAESLRVYLDHPAGVDKIDPKRFGGRSFYCDQLDRGVELTEPTFDRRL